MLQVVIAQWLFEKVLVEGVEFDTARYMYNTVFLL
jgi:hypothetical protein